MNGRRDTPHWRAFERARAADLDLFEELVDAIRLYAATRDTFTSKQAGDSILSRWERLEEWKRKLGEFDRAAFGIVLYETLSPDFFIVGERVGPDTVKRYRRK